MPKYLKTKEGSLESAVLEAVSPAQQAAIAISKKKKAGKPGYDDEGKSLKDDMTKEDKEAYEKFFNAALKKFGVDSPADFKSDEEKKKFFNYVDKNYKGENEKAEEVKEETLAMRTAKHISDMWNEAATKKEVKSEEEDEDEKKEDGKTMTGKPMNKIDTKVVEKD